MRNTVVVLLVLLIFLFLTVGACEAGPGSTQPEAMQEASRATIAAGRAIIISAAQTGTAVAHVIGRAQATADARALATAQAGYATATAQSAYATSTADAIHVQATMTQQALAIAGTRQAMQANATATFQVLHAQGTALAAAAAEQQLKLQREALTNELWAVTRWVIVLAAVALALLLAYYMARVRVIHRGDGKVLIVTPGAIYDPDRNPTPLLELGHGRRVSLPPISPDEQAATTARDQAIGLARASGRWGVPALHDANGDHDAEASDMSAEEPHIEILPPSRVPWLDEIERQLPPSVEGGEA